MAELSFRKISNVHKLIVFQLILFSVYKEFQQELHLHKRNFSSAFCLLVELWIWWNSQWRNFLWPTNIGFEMMILYRICCINLYKKIDKVSEWRDSLKQNMKYIKISSVKCKIMSGCISEFGFCVLSCYTSLEKSKLNMQNTTFYILK